MNGAKVSLPAALGGSQPYYGVKAFLTLTVLLLAKGAQNACVMPTSKALVLVPAVSRLVLALVNTIVRLLRLYQ